jgi:hypothetical protein
VAASESFEPCGDVTTMPWEQCRILATSNMHMETRVNEQDTIKYCWQERRRECHSTTVNGDLTVSVACVVSIVFIH